MSTDDRALEMWTVYRHPRDHPDQYVARMFLVTKEIQPTRIVFTADSLDEVRALLPPGLVCTTRSEADDPAIVEVWL